MYRGFNDEEDTYRLIVILLLKTKTLSIKTERFVFHHCQSYWYILLISPIMKQNSYSVLLCFSLVWQLMLISDMNYTLTFQMNDFLEFMK